MQALRTLETSPGCNRYRTKLTQRPSFLLAIGND